jgi:hypothetical protein
MPASVMQLPREAHMEMVPARPGTRPARATGRQAADNATEQPATLVHNTKAAGADPNEIAVQLEHRFGTTRDRAEIAGEIWLKGRKCRE